MPKKKSPNLKSRRVFATLVGVLLISLFLVINPESYDSELEKLPPKGVSESKSASESSSELNPDSSAELNPESNEKTALSVLEKLAVKGRAPKTGYSREEFYNSWPTVEGCSLRQRIIKRELGDTAVLSSEDNCTVISGEFDEPYTGSHLIFYQKSDLSSGIQIDHVVALSDAWQKGARELSKEERYALATDPLNLLAVDAKTNMKKSDGDASTWLPSNKKFRCAYVARQISVKYKYSLWVSQSEKETMKNVLETCPSEPAIGV